MNSKVHSLLKDYLFKPHSLVGQTWDTMWPQGSLLHSAQTWHKAELEIEDLTLAGPNFDGCAAITLQTRKSRNIAKEMLPNLASTTKRI